MPKVYLHYLGNESNESMLEAYGLKPKAQEIDKMKPRQCPNCNELNKIDSKFCVKCRMVLSYDSYLEYVKEKEDRVDINIRTLNTIELIMNRMKIFEKLLIQSGVVDKEGLLKLKHDSLKIVDDNDRNNANNASLVS